MKNTPPILLSGDCNVMPLNERLLKNIQHLTWIFRDPFIQRKRAFSTGNMTGNIDLINSSHRIHRSYTLLIIWNHLAWGSQARFVWVAPWSRSATNPSTTAMYLSTRSFPFEPPESGCEVSCYLFVRSMLGVSPTPNTPQILCTKAFSAIYVRYSPKRHHINKKQAFSESW